MQGARHYTAAFYDDQSAGSYKGAQRVLPIVFDIVHPRSVIDVGCGVGPWVRAAMDHGIQDALGIDGAYVDQSKLLIPADKFRSFDLSRPFSIGRTFDLAMSLEVAEHLSVRSAEGFVASLVALAPAILFSAAVPDQRGTHHVNEQWPSYWAAKFRPHSYHFWDCLRMKIWEEREVPCCYRQNCFLVCSAAFLSARNIALPQTDPVSLVHPALWEERTKEESRFHTVRGILSEFPKALGRPLKHLIKRKMAPSE